MRPPSSSSSSSAAGGGGGRVSAFTMRAVARMSRARWFIFLRRVYQYQNGPRSDLGSNPFNSPGWLALELGIIVAQMVLTAAVVATSPSERPAWPLRLWVAAYNVGNVLSLPLLYWRRRHSSAAAAAGRGDALSDDLEMRGASDPLRTAASAWRRTGRRRRCGSCRARTCSTSSAWTGGSGSSPLALSASKSSSDPSMPTRLLHGRRIFFPDRARRSAQRGLHPKTGRGDWPDAPPACTATAGRRGGDACVVPLAGGFRRTCTDLRC
ncbi:uncharacterized protein LOC120676313 isoform X2 [Panicum virgatum]|uniref:uncharacterized protein LOC120676313 isoform X2 n=1 Tax=Panicum virgatum TaxID=38727 RepID=UPI0019D69F38|nr:uncharacterized protein LOC120676313 isoform X2 [Panicum virgatum]